jgi:hypothetical protein
LELNKIQNAIQWCLDFLEAALAADAHAPTPIGPFPYQPLFDSKLEEGYQQTSPRYHSRSDINALLNQWRLDGRI